MNITPIVQNVNGQPFIFHPVALSFSESQKGFLVSQMNREPGAKYTAASVSRSHIAHVVSFINAAPDCSFIKFSKAPHHEIRPKSKLALARQSAMERFRAKEAQNAPGASVAPLPASSPSVNTSSPKKTRLRQSSRVCGEKLPLPPLTHKDFDNGFLLTESFTAKKSAVLLRNAKYVTKNPAGGKEIFTMGAQKHDRQKNAILRRAFLEAWAFYAPLSENWYYLTVTPPANYVKAAPQEAWIGFYKDLLYWGERLQATLHARVFWAMEANSLGVPHVHMLIGDNRLQRIVPGSLPRKASEGIERVEALMHKHAMSYNIDIRLWDKNDLPQYLLKQLTYSVQELADIEKEPEVEKRLYMREVATLNHWADVLKLRTLSHPRVNKNDLPQKKVLGENPADNAKPLQTVENTANDAFNAEYRAQILKEFGHCLSKSCGKAYCSGCLLGAWLRDMVEPWEPGKQLLDFYEWRALRLKGGLPKSE